MRFDPPSRADHVESLKRPFEPRHARERSLGAHDANQNLRPQEDYRGNPVTIGVQKRKLALLVEVAEELWGEH